MTKEALLGKRVGIAMTGSFCTFKVVFDVLKELKKTGCELFPILSYNAYDLDTRFYTAAAVREELHAICENEIWHTIQDVEPIGPKKLLDILVVMPCTGNTLSKLANGIADTPVTMACKSHWRNGRPVLIGISTNDGLAGSGKNIAELMNRKNVFFVPYRQDDPEEKATSLVMSPDTVQDAILLALEKKQIQPVFLKNE